MFKTSRSVLVLLISIFLTACGGGSSDSDGGSSPTVMPVNYNGNQTITVSGAGGSGSSTVGFSATVTGNSIKINDADFPNPGTVGASGNFRITENDLTLVVDATTTCTGSTTYNGNVSGNTVSGTITGAFTCNGIQIRVSGSFRGTSGSAKTKSPSIASTIASLL